MNVEDDGRKGLEHLKPKNLISRVIYIVLVLEKYDI